jgi:hypothetical protein
LKATIMHNSYRLKTFAGLAVMAAASALTTHAEAAVILLVVGNYTVTSYIVSASPACLFPAKTYLAGVYIYPGPSRAGSSARIIVDGAGGNVIEQFNFLPANPVAGATTWSGKYVQTFLPGGTPVTGNFSETIGYADSRSFVTTTTYTTVVNGVTCTTVAQESHVSIK